MRVRTVCNNCGSSCVIVNTTGQITGLLINVKDKNKIVLCQECIAKVQGMSEGERAKFLKKFFEV